MGATPICSISSTGISRPSLATVLSWVEQQYRTIYGSDVYLGSDSQDGEWVGLIASAIDDCNSMCVAAYNAYSPTTSQGVGLSSNVKLNNMLRLTPTYSVADLKIVGVADTQIVNGSVKDAHGNVWNLPALVSIPVSGQIIVQVKCTTLGAITANANEITIIMVPTLGWQSATNENPATPGNPIETDAELRIRQTKSTMLSANYVVDQIIGQLYATVQGVIQVVGYINDTNIPDDNGIPGHCIALVLETNGSLSSDIAKVIAAGKAGCGTYGTTSIKVYSPEGIPTQINFFFNTVVRVGIHISVKALVGYTMDTDASIKLAVRDWIFSLGIGVSVQLTRAYVAAYLDNNITSNSYEVMGITMSRGGAAYAASDIAIAFNERSESYPDTDITITLV